MKNENTTKFLVKEKDLAILLIVGGREMQEPILELVAGQKKGLP